MDVIGGEDNRTDNSADKGEGAIASLVDNMIILYRHWWSRYWGCNIIGEGDNTVVKLLVRMIIQL